MVFAYYINVCAGIQEFQQIVSQFKELANNIASEVEKERMKVSVDM